MTQKSRFVEFSQKRIQRTKFPLRKMLIGGISSSTLAVFPFCQMRFASFLMEFVRWDEKEKVNNFSSLTFGAVNSGNIRYSYHRTTLHERHFQIFCKRNRIGQPRYAIKHSCDAAPVRINFRLHSAIQQPMNRSSCINFKPVAAAAYISRRAWWRWHHSTGFPKWMKRKLLTDVNERHFGKRRWKCFARRRC